MEFAGHVVVQEVPVDDQEGSQQLTVIQQHATILLRCPLLLLLLGLKQIRPEPGRQRQSESHNPDHHAGGGQRRHSVQHVRAVGTVGRILLHKLQQSLHGPRMSRQLRHHRRPLPVHLPSPVHFHHIITSRGLELGLEPTKLQKTSPVLARRGLRLLAPGEDSHDHRGVNNAHGGVGMKVSISKKRLTGKARVRRAHHYWGGTERT
mmetsp:Transcript_54595/g.145856  ORF Transcript_54595/g.145856 Transcript_54595/m.145856 type:complete len:206 (-) Transcript_54595:19-636(-)